MLAEDRGDDIDERQHGKGDQRQLPAHVEHDGDDAGEHEYIFENGYHAGGEHLVERIHIGGDARDQPADRIAVEEGHVHVLQVAIDLAAQIEHYLLARPLHQVGLREFKDKAEGEQRDVNHADLGNSGQRLRTQEAVEKGMPRARLVRQVLVDGDFGQIGADDVGSGLEHDRHQRDRDLQAIGLQVPQQPAHQPGVIGLAEYFFFVSALRLVMMGHATLF